MVAKFATTYAPFIVATIECHLTKRFQRPALANAITQRADRSVGRRAGLRVLLVQRHRGAVPHVRLEQRVFACRHPLSRDRQQRAHVGVQLVLGAVVGVKRDIHRVLLGHLVPHLADRMDAACLGRRLARR